MQELRVAAIEREQVMGAAKGMCPRYNPRTRWPQMRVYAKRLAATEREQVMEATPRMRHQYNLRQGGHGRVSKKCPENSGN